MLPTMWLLFALAVPAMAVDGTDFSNNLFTDLAPLLALFGEQVSKQFLSESLGPADNILFALAPLGIITGVVSAIRLSGYTWLKAMVGRLSETRGAAEIELTAATSADVCELWDGRSVARILGKPSILAVAFVPDGNALKDAEPEDPIIEEERRPLVDGDEADELSNEESISDLSVLTFDEAKMRGWFRGPNYWASKDRAEALRVKIHSQRAYEEDTLPPRQENLPLPPKPIPPIPPNLSLNLRRRSGRAWVRCAALLSIIIQSMVLVFAAIFTFLVSETDSNDYAFGLLAGGTLLMCVGVYICAWRVTSSSTFEEWTPIRNASTKKSLVRLVWLQKQQVVNDETFPSCVLEPKQDDIVLAYSEEANRSIRNPAVLVGIALSLVGFVLQFVGFRYLHWSVSVAQLVAMLLVVLIRVFIRLPFSRPSPRSNVVRNFELEWVLVELHGTLGWHPQSSAPEIGDIQKEYKASEQGKVLDTRIQLGTMARQIGWELYYTDDGILIKDTIEAVLDCLWSFNTDVKQPARMLPTVRWPVLLGPLDGNDARRLPGKAFLQANRERHAGGWTK